MVEMIPTVDKAFPSDCSPWLLEVNSHKDM